VLKKKNENFHKEIKKLKRDISQNEDDITQALLDIEKNLEAQELKKTDISKQEELVKYTMRKNN